MRRTTFFAGLFALGTVAAGCLDDSITGTRPITLSITAESETAVVGELVTVTYRATGTGLSSVTMDWGDGATDEITLGGLFVEADGTAKHAYSAAGSYDITGTANARNGTASSEVTVQIS